MTKRKNHSPDFKAQVALEAIHEEMTMAGSCRRRIACIQRRLAPGSERRLKYGRAVFSRRGGDPGRADEAQIDKLHSKIGQLVVERDHDLIVRRQSGLLSLVRSNLYYQPKDKSIGNLRFMEIIDRQFLETLWYSSRQMARYSRQQSHKCGRHPTPCLPSVCQSVHPINASDAVGTDLSDANRIRRIRSTRFTLTCCGG